MKKITLLLLLCFLLSCTRYSSITEVKGEWELYRNNFVYSDNFNGTKEIIDLPGGFVDTLYRSLGDYGTIKKVIPISTPGSYSLYFTGLYSASRIWIDSKLVAEYGIIGKTLESTKPYIKPDVVSFYTEKKDAELVIEYSNFHLKENLLFKKLYVGEKSASIQKYIKDLGKDYFTAGILIIISIFFGLIFITKVSYKYNLYFSLFTLFYGIRSFLMEKVTIEMFIETIPWHLIYQLTKASEMWSLIFIILFFRELYPMELKTKITKRLLFGPTLISLLSFLPLHIFSGIKIMYFSHGIYVVSGMYLMLKIFESVKKERVLAKFTLISLAIFSLATINDILSNRYIIPWGYYSAQAVILLVLAMAVLVSKNRSLTEADVKEEEEQSARLRATFEKFVPVEILKLIGNRDLESREAGDAIITPLAIAYIDIRDFTKLSSGLTPKDNFTMVNNFFEIVGLCVDKHNGFIESYGGDGVKVIFPKDPNDAIEMALMLSDMVNKTSGIKIGISLNFGKVVLGTVGSEKRIQAASFSNTTRELYAMDNFNSRMGVEILLSQSIYNVTKPSWDKILYLGGIKLKNEPEEKGYYQLIPGTLNLDYNFKDAFQSGIRELDNKNYPRAYGFFSLAKRLKPSHLLSCYYVEKLEEFFRVKPLSFSLSM